MTSWLAILFLKTFTSLTVDTSDKFVSVRIPTIVVEAGESSIINVEIEVKKGFHIRANRLTDEYLIPTTLTLNSDGFISIGEQIFPVPGKFKLVGSENVLDVYEGIFTVKIPIEIDKKIKRGAYQLRATLHYQACDSTRCLFPRTLDFLIPVKVL